MTILYALYEEENPVNNEISKTPKDCSTIISITGPITAPGSVMIMKRIVSNTIIAVVDRFRFRDASFTDRRRENV